MMIFIELNLACLNIYNYSLTTKLRKFSYFLQSVVPAATVSAAAAVAATPPPRISAEEERRRMEEEERQRQEVNRQSLESAVQEKIKRQLQSVLERAEVRKFGYVHMSHFTNTYTG